MYFKILSSLDRAAGAINPYLSQYHSDAYDDLLRARKVLWDVLDAAGKVISDSCEAPEHGSVEVDSTAILNLRKAMEKADDRD